MPEMMIAIPLAKLKPSPLNPRKHLGDPAKLSELAASMKEHGVLEPAIVRQGKGETYELVCGHRRFAAAKEAQLDGLPAIVRELTDDQVLDIQIIENSQREDVHPMDEARAFEQAVERGRTVSDIADKIGRPASFVAQRMQLLKLGKEAREALEQGKVTLAVAQLIARIPDTKLQRECLFDIEQDSYDGPVTADTARKLIEERYMLRLGDAPFDITDAKLVPKAGACSACPKRTGNQAQLFADVKNVDLCIDAACFEAKKAAIFQIRLKEAKAGGQEVLEGKEADKAMSHDSSYVALDAEQWVNGKRKSVRSIVGKAKPPVILAKGKDGEVRELIKKADYQKCLPKQAATESRRETAADRAIAKANKDRAAKDRRRAAAVTRAIGMAVDKVGQIKPEKLTSLLVRCMIGMAWNDTQTAVIRRRELVKPGKDGKTPHVNAEKRLLDHADSLPLAELAGLGLEVVLRRAAPHSNWPAKREWSEVLGALKVDYAAIEREVAAEAKAKDKGKGTKPQREKAATKATAKKKPTKGKGRG